MIIINILPIFFSDGGVVRASAERGDMAAGSGSRHQRHPETREEGEHIRRLAQHQPAHLHQPHHAREHRLLHTNVGQRLQGRRQKPRRYKPVERRAYKL